MSKYGCDGELVKIDCEGAGLVIQIVRANYGRLSPSVCPPSPPGGAGAASDCLHRSTKAVLDRRCGGSQTCVLRASEATFSGSECPGVSKYLEIHFRCVADRQRSVSGERGAMVPPWLQDLHATFRPATLGSTPAPPRPSDDSDNDGAPDDDEVLSTVISDDPQSSQNSSTASPNSQGRYFLIHDHVGESVGESDSDSSMTSLVVGVTVSIVSTLLSVLIIVHICRKVRSKPLPLAGDSDQSCYQCTSSTNTYQLDSAAKLSSQVPVPVIPVQNIIYAPLSEVMAPLSPPRDGLGPDPDTNVIYR